eukprot:TRINITY_DN20243_c0_g1_i1.p1 TRINITY_DN20243_c0_g1~~TRINITY_DN20243_c0_g1_i1.p1  ORF type:complete len:123 (-),score=52.50 TRINITY_DN20243_c0_g1_i1:79-447(-)
MCFFFFFQAEDGIRDLVRSRGLGDVYKRQYQRRARGRYDYLLAGWFGDMPELYVSENDLIRAEARANLGDLPGAALIINTGTRVTRGEMTPVACLLYTSDAADDLLCVDLGGRRIIKKKKSH